ncbi:PREDICTED: NF-X1-type zinc finger protein NFXL2 [Nicotiana attenuata]|uniref:Nf-x1-type zinc finger protein nfxl2 n=1 Tax=Nicotiana attenuata TaxID=49451 RepID=A0A314LBA5_NICAT|nr:PREDICTED: NF-X1-type zinc finger protein NFXL2 [Nicotiana attenuata]OIT38905.1 nf-x1-type zinc finger protein nfxl2 [Nicotiana attenuata]
MTSWSATVAPPLSPPSSDSDSDSATTSDSHHHRHSDLSSTIFKSYLEHSSGDHNNQQQQQHDLIKIQSFLTSSRSGALSCLICLERIRPSDPTWSCSSGCFAVFHLHCIQSWGVQCSNLAAARAVTRAATPNDSSLLWHCPKCRVEYSKSQIPKNYYCFCGKLPDPPHDPWVLPHSCNEICGRPLKYNCGHHCLLLCHPGPCPACPKLVKSKCFCGAVEDVKRCGFKNFSCNGVCKKLLDCKTHRCSETCHEGNCPPCKAKGIYNCQCGKLEMKRECFDRFFRCENPCDKLLGCGRHKCERGCHEGDCGDCPLQGKRTCPCGKRVYEGIACDAPVSVCGATCGKMLSCGFHRCPERCHRGPCIETCRVVVTKSCRCGSYRKQVPCYQDMTCERKCQKMRDCGRHACKRKCCDGDCPPCSEMCDRKLRCRNHKCPAPCHRGACAPCPVMVTISCLCGVTHFEVPCGAEAEQKPPKCRKPCRVDRLCRHASNCKPHRCHYGACPPCRLLCDEEYPCGHKCELRCHGPTQPPLPEFTLKPKKRRLTNQTELTPGSSCPPCPQLVWRSCWGNHVGAERMMVCSDRTVFSCDNLCGNPLPCGNHYCTKVCHALVSSTSKLYGSRRPESCEECTLPCQQERKPTCPHPCPLRCHPGECPPCKALIKRSCHCGSMVHVFECIYYNSLSAKEQLTVRSCGGPCHRKLPNCTHLCPEICHPGECPSPDQCSKKVTARCGCQTLKKELVCKDVQAAYRSNGTDPKDVSRNQYGLGILPCNSDCRSKVKAAEGELQHRKSKAPEEKEPETKDNVTKRRRRKGRALEDKKTSTLQRIIAGIKRFLLFVIVIIALIASVYLGYKGLLWVSDWMNEAEIQRQRRYSRT